MPPCGRCQTLFQISGLSQDIAAAELPDFRTSFQRPPTLWVRLVFRGYFQSVPMLCSFFVISVLFSIAEFCSDAMKKNFEKIMNFYEVNFRHLSFYVRIEKKKENH